MVAAAYVAVWGLAVVVLPNGLVRGLTLMLGLPGLYSVLAAAKRLLA